MAKKVKKHWRLLLAAGIRVGSLKSWARAEVQKCGPWASECRTWLNAKRTCS